jgi:DNA ligase (NAD+)
MAAGIGLSEGAVVAEGAPLEGEKVVVSGSVPGLSRSQAQEAVERLGGKSSSAVSASTTLLVAGEGAGSKVAKAEALGVRVMSAEDFAALVARS